MSLVHCIRCYCNVFIYLFSSNKSDSNKRDKSTRAKPDEEFSLEMNHSIRNKIQATGNFKNLLLALKRY